MDQGRFFPFILAHLHFPSHILGNSKAAFCEKRWIPQFNSYVIIQKIIISVRHLAVRENMQYCVCTQLRRLKLESGAPWSESPAKMWQ